MHGWQAWSYFCCKHSINVIIRIILSIVRIKKKLQVAMLNGFELVEEIAYELQICSFGTAVMAWVRRWAAASIFSDWRCSG